MKKRTAQFLVYAIQALFLTFIFSRIIWTDFAMFRSRVISGTFAPTGRLLTADFERPSKMPVGPLMFGVKMSNPENRSKIIRVILNSKDQGEIHLKPRKTAEYFLDLEEKYLWSRNRIEFEGSDNQWELRDLEIKNIYGFSRGLFNFVIIPKSAKTYLSLPGLCLPALAILLFLLGWLSGVIRQKKLAPGLLSLTFSLSALLVLACAALLPSLSKYRALFSLKSLWLFIPWLYCGLTLSLLKDTYDWGRTGKTHGLKIFQAVAEKLTRRKKLIVAVFVPLVVFLFFFNIMLHTLNFFRGNYSKFMHFADRFVSDTNPIFWDVSAEPLFPNSDFEKGTLENWTATGDAFISQPNKSKQQLDWPIVCQGRHWIGTFDKSQGKYGNKSFGTLTSIPFTIKKDKIGFLISGGNSNMAQGRVRESLALEVDNQIVRKDTGKNDDIMEHRAWDVRPWVGKEARILITDENSPMSYSRHINVDWLHYHEQDRMDKIKNRLIKDKGGYDGQFYYFIAYDPFLSRFGDNPSKYRYMVDEPAYRFGRIGFPLLIKLFSLDRPEIYSQTIIRLILLSHFIGAFFLLKIVQFFKQSPLWTFLYILVPGFQLSLHFACPEPISLALFMAGLYFYLKQKMPLASLLFAGSILIRETVAFFILAVVLYELFKKKNVKTAFLMAASVLPYIFWRLFLTLRLFPCYGWKAFFFQPNDFDLPFSGFIELYRRVIAGNYFKALASAALAYPVMLVIIFLFSLYFIWKRIDALSLGMVFFSLIPLLLNYTKIWVHIDNGIRPTQEVFVFLILVFVSQKDRLKPASRNLCLGFFCFVFLFDYFFLSVHHFFRAGFFLR